MLSILQGISNFFQTLWSLISSFFDTVGYVFQTVSDFAGIASSFLPSALLTVLIGFVTVYIFVKILK